MKGSLMKKGKWSKEEDNLLKNYIEKYGIGRSWQGLSDTLGIGRCGRSCRSRWLNYLRPGLKHGGFTPAEDMIIFQMYKRKGSCWSAIAAELPGRTDLAIKNYWNGTLKKRFRRTGRTSADATSMDLALVEESTGGTTTAREPPLVMHNVNEATATAGPSPSHAGVAWACSPVQPPPPPTAAAKDDHIAAVPVSGPVKMAPRTPPPPGDETSEEMDAGCCPMSPIPLGLMEMDLDGFDDIDSFLSYFDH